MPLNLQQITAVLVANYPQGGWGVYEPHNQSAYVEWNGVTPLTMQQIEQLHEQATGE